MGTNKRAKGEIFEQRAAQFLVAQGGQIVTRNFNCRMGEIDIICFLEPTLVFVEVRFRGQNRYGGAAATISPQKQNKIKRSAMFYLQSNGYNVAHTRFRFDVIAFDSNIEQLNWIKNAF
ncbi:YraN family protein [Gayadomonas joobiniege]|uniref:YraN family protein n=1 Tax=Gayadomonas joobiniege TaxID=1234606 RepID=UPI000366E286|nr:YraN family protein [Gayadomonas joobiniege]